MMNYLKFTSILLSIALILSLTIFLTSCQSSDYSKAKELIELKKYEEANEILENLVGYEDSDELIKECKYNIAISQFENGQYSKAASIFSGLGNYKEATNKNMECKVQLIKEKLKTVSVGDTIVFGHFEQDYDYSTYEPLEWIVLDKKDNKLLVTTKYIIEAMQYYEEFSPAHKWGRKCTYENSDIRKWLNNEFIKYFSDEEAQLIQETRINADSNPDKGTSAGNSTNDKAFLLSINEAKKYFSSDKDRKCDATNHACNMKDVLGNYRSVYVRTEKIEEGAGQWWLRTPGYSEYTVSYVGIAGNIVSGGENQDYEHNGIRPAMYINIQ